MCDPLSLGLPGKNPGVGCHFLLQGIFLTQGLNLYRLAGGFFTTAPLGIVYCNQTVTFESCNLLAFLLPQELFREDDLLSEENCGVVLIAFLGGSECN